VPGFAENGTSDENLAEAQIKPEHHKTELEILHRRLGEALKAQATKDGEIVTLNSQMDALHKKVEEHKVTILRHTQKMDQTTKTLATRNSEVKNLKTQLEKAKKEHEAGKTEIKTLKSRLADLEKDVLKDRAHAHESEEDANTTKKGNSDLQSLQKERDVFRDIAMRLYASKVDQESGFADRHVSMSKITQLLKAQAEQTQTLVVLSQTELGLLQRLHEGTGTVLNEVEARMTKGGLADEWVKFETEAMNLE